jgi:transcriptional regulator GlxA family with amidase domain
MPATCHVAILAFPGVQMLDLVGPADVFAEAAAQLGQPDAYKLSVIASQAGELRGSNGMRVAVDATLATQRGRIDTLLVAGSPRVWDAPRDPATAAWLQKHARTVARIGSVCTGAFVLAEAGLLDGKRATTHWNSAERLAASYPTVQVTSDNIYVKDGKTYTSAGVTAGMDMALFMVEEDHGRDLALRVARELVMFLKRPGGQSQYSAYLAAQTADKSTVRDIQEHVLANLGADLSVPALCKLAAMSERNFARVFRAATGVTPAAFVESARIDEARRLVEASDVPMKKLADTLGYANVDGFRRAFARRLGVSPNDYRRRFAFD